MRDEYYQVRQWDVSTGFQTRESLEALDLSEVGEDLGRRGLIGKSSQDRN
jgi:hypothetical protein